MSILTDDVTESISGVNQNKSYTAIRAHTRMLVRSNGKWNQNKNKEQAILKFN